MNYNKLSELRRKTKVSIEELAEALGMTESGYKKMIRLESCKVQTLEKIAEYFKVPVAYFFEKGEGEMLIKKAQGSILTIPEEVQNKVEEPYTCSNCSKLQNKINKLYEDLIEAKNETIAAQNREQKNEKVS